MSRASVVIWTTTPWTIPGNRAVAYSPAIAYGLYEVTASPDGNWAKVGERLVIADALAEDMFKAARVEGFRAGRIGPAEGVVFAPFGASSGDSWAMISRSRSLPAITSPPRPAPASSTPHRATAREDFDLWTENARSLKEQGIDAAIPFTVDADGIFTAARPASRGGG